MNNQVTVSKDKTIHCQVSRYRPIDFDGSNVRRSHGAASTRKEKESLRARTFSSWSALHFPRVSLQATCRLLCAQHAYKSSSFFRRRAEYLAAGSIFTFFYESSRSRAHADVITLCNQVTEFSPRYTHLPRPSSTTGGGGIKPVHYIEGKGASYFPSGARESHAPRRIQPVMDEQAREPASTWRTHSALRNSRRSRPLETVLPSVPFSLLIVK